MTPKRQAVAPPLRDVILSDLLTVAAVLAAGHLPSETERGPDGRMHFRFSPDVAETVEAYFNRTLQIDARTFADKLRSTRELVRNGGRR